MDKDVEDRGSRTILLAVLCALQPHGLRDESGTRLKGVYADRVGLRMSGHSVTLIGEWKVSWKFSSLYRYEQAGSVKHQRFRQVLSQVY